MDICIIGGGMMGLATAYYLSGSDNNIVVLEKENEVGGLSRSAEICPGLRWDRYYHVILSTDTNLLNFIDDIGLSLDVRFRTTKTGFFTDGRLHSMSNIFEFITFKPLPLVSKFRLGLGILFASRIRNGTRLEKVYAKNWLIRIFGRRNYEKLWDPLLRSKLGTASPKASGAFIWAIIKRYYGTRKNGSKQELMGCIRGGYHSIFNQIQEILKRKQVAILLDRTARKIVPQPDGRIGVTDQRGETSLYDKVVSTLPNPNVKALLPEGCRNLKAQLSRIDYLNLVCVVLVLKRSLCPYYVTNITDPGFPFTGVIEATNVVPEDILGGRALVYLPRWMPEDDPYIHQPDGAILEQFYGGLKRVFPDFDEDQVTAAHVHREYNVQPIQTLDYQHHVPSMETEISGLYLVNTSMILNSTLNNNQVIGLARKMAARLLESE
jgi:protoporphyrinogen oxidase